MTETKFAKELTMNDTGESSTHQAGIHIQKKEGELIEFLPYLDPSIKNPDRWIVFVDETGCEWTFRYIYYNNKLHDERGTRDEYRLTHTTKYFRAVGAKSGDTLQISQDDNKKYRIEVIPGERVEDGNSRGGMSTRIRLKGWRRVH